MIVITTRDRIKDVAKRWKAQYHSKGGWVVPIFGNREEVYLDLKKLNIDTCKKEDVDNIIGNTSWTDLTCNECNRHRNSLVILEKSESYFEICPSCLTKAKEKITCTD